MHPIADIQLRSLIKRLEERNIQLNISDQVIITLAERGFNPLYGARPLKRVIQTWIQDPLADLLLSGNLADNQQLTISIANGELVFSSVDENNNQVMQVVMKQRDY